MLRWEGGTRCWIGSCSLEKSALIKTNVRMGSKGNLAMRLSDNDWGCVSIRGTILSDAFGGFSDFPGVTGQTA